MSLILPVVRLRIHGPEHGGAVGLRSGYAALVSLRLGRTMSRMLFPHVSAHQVENGHWQFRSCQEARPTAAPNLSIWLQTPGSWSHRYGRSADSTNAWLLAGFFSLPPSTLARLLLEIRRCRSARREVSQH